MAEDEAKTKDEFEIDPDARATKIEVSWSDGLHHSWAFQPDGRWTLTLTGPPGDPPRITGYTREDMERVLGKALAYTRSTLEFGGDVFTGEMAPLTVTKPEMVGLVRDLLSWIEGDDSMEGHLSYEWHPERPGEYRVGGVLRMGNSQGQGGVRLLRADLPGTS